MCPDDKLPTAKDEPTTGEQAKDNPTTTDAPSRPSEWSDEIWYEEIRNPTRLRKFTLEERKREAEIMRWRRPKQRGKYRDKDAVPRLLAAALLRDYDRKDGGGGGST